MGILFWIGELFFRRNKFLICDTETAFFEPGLSEVKGALLKDFFKADDIRVILEYRAQGLRISTHARKGPDSYS